MIDPKDGVSRLNFPEGFAISYHILSKYKCVREQLYSFIVWHKRIFTIYIIMLCNKKGNVLSTEKKNNV